MRAAVASGPPTPPVRLPPRLQSPRRIAFLGDTAVVVRGAASGLSYLFGPRGEALEVDERDVPALVASGWFVLA
jgi:hypothetical protein